MRQKAWRAGYCGSSHSPVAAVLRHLHRPAPPVLLVQLPFSVRAGHAVSHLFLYHAVCLSVCFAVAWLLLCLVYVLRVPVLVEMTWLEGLKVGYEEGISERVGGVVCWENELTPMFDVVIVSLWSIALLGVCADV
jgi:hypothetical protein